MCSNYLAPATPEEIQKHFGVTPPSEMGIPHVWHSKKAIFIRKPKNADNDPSLPKREAVLGFYGLIPHWNKNEKLSQVTARTYNARSETAAEKPSFRDPWRKGQHCIVPAESIIEPDWRTGKHIPARIWLADKKPMGLAGLWERWVSPDGEEVLSFTILTINADDHPLYKNLHKSGEEKRMVVILPEDKYDEWLSAAPKDSMAFLKQYPGEGLIYEHVAR